MNAKDHIKIILQLPSLEYDRQVERIADILWIGHSNGFSFDDIAEAVIDAERKEVLSSLHISGALNGALKAIEDAEAERDELARQNAVAWKEANAARDRALQQLAVLKLWEEAEKSYYETVHSLVTERDAARAALSEFLCERHQLRCRLDAAEARIKELEASLSIALEALREIAADQPSERPDETSTDYTPFPAGYDAALFDQGSIAAMALIKIAIRKDQTND